MLMQYEDRISVRSLVEFILREGDIDKRFGQSRDVDLMQQGAKIHRKIQKGMGMGYDSEVSLKLPVFVEGGKIYFKEEELPGKEDSLKIILDGRADGIFKKKDCVVIDEIKAVNQEVRDIKAPKSLHLAQARCYAMMYWILNEKLPGFVQITYCSIEGVDIKAGDIEAANIKGMDIQVKDINDGDINAGAANNRDIKRFEEPVDEKELKKWFENLIISYSKWVFREAWWIKERDLSLKKIEFPFPYRKGQRELALDIYRTIMRKKRVFIEAPTGVGKTISAMFPAMKAMGEGLGDKVFYLTAKTITRQVAMDTVSLFKPQDIRLKAITLTAREKICPLPKMECSPEACERAKGHFDRINSAVFDLISNENEITREIILDYAKKHCVCPFEMSLDTALWSDVIIGDYNYAFDPEAKLKRFFGEGSGKERFIFLVDEAHNLVERARDMYSAVLVKEDFLRIKRLVPAGNKKLIKRLEICNRDFLKQKRQCEKGTFGEVYIPKVNEGTVKSEGTAESEGDIEIEAFHLMNLQAALDEFLKNNKKIAERDTVLEFYFDVCKFLNVYETLNDKYRIYGDFSDGKYCLHLCCMDPSDQLSQCLDMSEAGIFFSATLLPVKYYKEQLAGREEDYAIYAPSPFLKENRLIMVAGDVSTKYTRRGPKEYEKILEYLYIFSMSFKGNYMFFFPSYQMLRTIADMWQEKYEKPILVQESTMMEKDREEFLQKFEGDSPVVAFCVMGGIFGEGIDLTGKRLVGTAIVGTGLPMVCLERQLYKEYFDKKGKDGFKYAYMYPGMNKVMQAAGRVIRTMEDRGCILLLDERFENREYQKLFPKEWFPYRSVRAGDIKGLMEEFWGR